jgi:PPOX class probable F420-dependent enzyme
MADLNEAVVQRLLEERNHAIISTHTEDGAIHSAVVWVNVEDGMPAVNSAIGRRWPANVERDSRVTLLVYDEANPYEYVEIRGRAKGRTAGAEDHIDRLTQKYMGVDRYPFRAEGERRITYLVEPESVRHQKQ